MTITVNGAPRTVDDGTTLADLLAHLDLDPRLIVVEYNRSILRERDQYALLTLAPGDTLELVHFVGGG